MRNEKAEGPAEASPPNSQVVLERCDVSSDFHRDGNDFSFGLGPGHGALRKVVGLVKTQWVLSPIRTFSGSDDTAPKAGDVP
jgi:hypothetical protein